MDSSRNRQSNMQYIPGFGDYEPIPGLGDDDHPVAYQPAPTESNQPKFTPEAASDILLHFGLEKEDLEHLITYPEDQLTPANLPIVLRQIRQQKDMRASTAVPSNTGVQPSSSRKKGRTARRFTEEPPQKECRSSAWDSTWKQPCFFTSASSSSHSGASQSTDQKVQMQKDTDTRDFLPAILKSILKKREPEHGKTTKMQQPQPSNHGLVLSGRNETCSSADQSKSSGVDDHAARKKHKKQTQQKEMEPEREQEAQGWQTQLQERHAQQMSQYPFQSAQTMWPPVSYPVNSGPSHFHSAYYGNPHHLVSYPIPQPTMGSMTYNYMAQMTFNTSTTQVPYSAPTLTQSMKNDYAAIPPGSFPHTCSLCYRRCSNIQDWMFHQNTTVHLRNCKQLRETYQHQLGGVDTTSRYDSNSISESLSRRFHHGTEGGRSMQHDRANSPHRSRYHYRSRSRSPKYDVSTSSRHDPRSPERRSRRSDRRRSASRSSEERRSSPRRSQRRKRGRRSSTEGSSPEKGRDSSVERLAKKILETPDDSSSYPSDLDAVVKALVPTLMAELAKVTPSSSFAGERRSPSSSAPNEVSQPSASSRETQLMEKQVQQQTSGDPQISKDNTRPPSNVVDMQASAGIYTFTVGEILDKLLDQEKIGSFCFGLRSAHKLPKAGNRQLVITNLPQYCPGSYTEDDIAKLLSSFGFQHTDDNIFLFPKACLAFALMPTPLSAGKVLSAISEKPLELREAKLTVRVLCPIEMMTPLGLYKKLMVLMKSPTSDEGQSIIFIKQISQEEISELREAAKDFNGFKNFMPLLNKVFVEFDTEQDADCFRNQCSLQKTEWSTKMFKLKTSSPSKCEQSMASQSVKPGAGKKKQRTSSFIYCLADGTPLTPGEMIGMSLNVEKIGCVEENTWKSPQFSWRKNQILITELPAAACYTEQEISRVLAPFGIQFKEDDVYVIPRARMAFIPMQKGGNLQKLMKSQKDDPVILQEAKLCFHLPTSCINVAPLEFYKSLMGFVDFHVTDNGTRTIYIKNISQSDSTELREALKKITGVRNFLPMLNRVFVEFDSSQDADWLGAWYSFQKRDLGHTVFRLKEPSSGCTASLPRCPEGALPVTKDVIEGITLPTFPQHDFCLPQGTFGAFWITMRSRPYIFPTSSPWFIIPEYQTIRGQPDIKTAMNPQSPTVMLTNLPEGNYKHQDFVHLVNFCNQDLQSVYYNMIVLPLQRRAFVFFKDKNQCSDFLIKHIRTPLLLFDQSQIRIHIVTGDMKPESTEVMMYRSLMKWSNAGAPDPDSLEERLLCVWISSVSVVLVRSVMKEVASIAPFVNFLPLANRICIEMAEPSGVAKVLEKKKSFAYIAFGQIHVGSQILDIETAKDLKQRLSSSVSPNLILDTGSQSALQASRPDETINPTSEVLSSSGTCDEANTKEIEKPMPLTSEGLSPSGASDEAKSKEVGKPMPLAPEGPSPSGTCEEAKTKEVGNPEPLASKGPSPSGTCEEAKTKEVDQTVPLTFEGSSPSGTCEEAKTKEVEIPVPLDSEGLSPSGTSDEAKTKEVEKPVPLASSASLKVDKDVKRKQVEEASPKHSVPATTLTPAAAQCHGKPSVDKSLTPRLYGQHCVQASSSKYTHHMGQDDFTEDNIPSCFLFFQETQKGNSVTARKAHIHEGHKPHRPLDASSPMEDSTKPVPASCGSMSSSSPVGTETLPSCDRKPQLSDTKSSVKSSSMASSSLSFSAQETRESKSQITVTASNENQLEQLVVEVTEADGSLVMSGCAEGTFKPDTKAERQTQSKGEKEESGVRKTDGQTNEEGEDNTSKTQSAGPEDPQTLHQECFENISVEPKVQTDDNELGADGSLHGKDSHMVQDDGKDDKEGGDETKSKEEGVGTSIAASHKAFDDVEKCESKTSNEELQLQESSNILKDLDTNVTTKESCVTVDFIDNQTAAENQASDKQLSKDNDFKIEKDTNRIVDSVEELPTTIVSETNRAVELEDPAKKGGRSSRRRGQAVKASRSDEKKNSPKKQNKEDFIPDHSATQETVIDEVDSVEDDVRNNATKESSVRRSTRGKKGKEVETHPPEAPSQLLDSVKDETFSDAPTIKTRSSRGMRKRVKMDTSVEAQAPHNETTPTDRVSVVEEDVCEEVPTNEMLDHVEDKALNCVNNLNQQTPLTLDEAGGGEKSEGKQTAKTLLGTKRKNDDGTVTGERGPDFCATGTKKSRSQSPSVPAHYELPKFKPNNPLGLEFIVPRSGYFCNLCSIFYLNERTAKSLHCSSQKHYNNLKVHTNSKL